MRPLPNGTFHVLIHYLRQHERFCTIDVTALYDGMRYELRVWPSHLPQLYSALIGQPKGITRGQVDITVVVKDLGDHRLINNVRKISPPRAGVIAIETGVPLPEDIVREGFSFDDFESEEWPGL